MLIALLIVIVFTGLYLAGFLPVSVKRAKTFIGNMGAGRSRCEASFTECTGRIHRVIRFRESRSYSFRLDSRIQSGSITVTLADRNRCPLMILDAGSPSGVLPVQSGQMYFLSIRFQNASGDYHLDWT